jgi:hypothetical protein
MVNRKRLTLCMGVLCMALIGCSAYPKKVDCEAHLRAINVPAPASKGTTP